MSLSDREREVLAFEKQWWQHAGSKDQAIRDLFGWTATEYFRRLDKLIDRPEALEAEPVVVNRLRALRQARQDRWRTLRSA